MRCLYLLLPLTLTPFAEAASLSDYQLHQTLEQVAIESSKGTPRAINADILDQGYTVEGTALVNHLSVRPEHASRMLNEPVTVRNQLMASVCKNTGYRQLLARGAVLVYRFSEYKSNRPVVSESFTKADCGLQ